MLVGPILAGEVVVAGRAMSEPFVDADDIADAAVAALTEEGHIGQLYEVTGPRMLTFAEAIGEIAAAIGRTSTTAGSRRADSTPGLRAEVPAEFAGSSTNCSRRCSTAATRR